MIRKTANLVFSLFFLQSCGIALASPCSKLFQFQPLVIRDVMGVEIFVDQQMDYYFQTSLFLLREVLRGLRQRGQDIRFVDNSDIEDLLLEAVPLRVALDLHLVTVPWDQVVQRAVRRVIKQWRGPVSPLVTDQQWFESLAVRQSLRTEIYFAVRPL